MKFGFADYDDFYKDLGTLSGKVSVDLSSANSRIHRELTLNEKAVIENVKSVVKKFKGVKNDREVQGFKDCHIRDGAALCQYFGWLEDQLLNKKNTEIDEFSGAEVLHDFRGSFDWSKGDSFETISSVGANAAKCFLSRMTLLPKCPQNDPKIVTYRAQGPSECLSEVT